MYFIFILYIILERSFVYFLVHNIIQSKELICTFFTQVTAEEVVVQLYILFKIIMVIIIVFEA